MAHIAFGSNIDPEENIPKALEMLDADCPITALSTVYWSPPEGNREQPPFLNGACSVKNSWDARKLKFDVLRSIERRLGRVRGNDKYAPRTIDLDIALFGGAVIQEPDLVAPDPDIETRPFLALPLYELLPQGVLPGSGLPLADIVNRLDVSTLKAHEALSLRLKKRFIA